MIITNIIIANIRYVQVPGVLQDNQIKRPFPAESGQEMALLIKSLWLLQNQCPEHKIERQCRVF